MTPTITDSQILLFLAKGVLFAALAVVFACALGKRCSACASSIYWRCAVVGLIALPIVALYLPVLPLVGDGGRAAGKDVATVPLTSSDGDWRVSYPDALPLASLLPEAGADSGAVEREAAGRAWVLLAWQVGVLLVFLRWALARLHAGRLVRRASLLEDEGWRRTLRHFGRRGERLPVLVSEESKLPVVFGLLRPTLLLPSEAVGWDEATRRSVIAHEMGHVRRGDGLFLLLSHMALALHWVNPFAWVIARRLRMADERCADDSVLADGGEPAEYASILLEFARCAPGSGSRVALAVPSMAQRSTVGQRVECLLDAGRRRGGPSPIRWVSGTLALLSAAFVVGALTTREAHAAQAESGVAERRADPEVELREKLKRIVIPAMHFDEASIADAIDFLRLKSRELDVGESDPKMKGVNFIVKGGGEVLDAKISLELANVPLAEALNFLTQLSGLRYTVEGHAVVIAPPDEPGDLITRTWRVTPNFVESLRESAPEAGAGGGGGAPRGLRDLLAAQGVSFPEGASAQYLPATSSLVLRNTAGNLDLVEELTRQMEKDLPGVIKLRVELYEMPKGEALKIVTAADSKPAAGEAIDRVRALVDKGEAKILVTPSIMTRSGQRAKVEAGEWVEYIASYRDVDGADVPVTRKVLAGTSVEIDPVCDADGRTIHVNIAISMARGEPTIIKRKMVGPASGIEREIESVSIASQQLASAFVTLTGQTQLVGNLQSDKIDDPNAVLAFVTATVTVAKPE